MTRFPETKGGQFSRDTAIMEIRDSLRLISERCMSLGHHDKMQGDIMLGDNWLKMGKKFQEAENLVLMMGTQGRA